MDRFEATASPAASSEALLILRPEASLVNVAVRSLKEELSDLRPLLMKDGDEVPIIQNSL
jgi:hypothetical protein